jgi:hypothetical protein
MVLIKSARERSRAFFWKWPPDRLVRAMMLLHGHGQADCFETARKKRALSMCRVKFVVAEAANSRRFIALSLLCDPDGMAAVVSTPRKMFRTIGNATTLYYLRNSFPSAAFLSKLAFDYEPARAGKERSDRHLRGLGAGACRDRACALPRSSLTKRFEE